MNARTKSHRVPVVVFDDGSLTRNGLERVARYASEAHLVGGVRGPALAGLLGGLGVPVREQATAVAGIGSAAELAASRAAVLVTGTPLDPQGWLTALAATADGIRRNGLVVHVPAAGHTGSAAVTALTPAAQSWTGPLGAAFGTLAALHADTSAGSGEAADVLEAGAADCLFISAAVPYPEQVPEPAAAPAYALSAADTVLAVLTDTAIEVTNRSPVRVRVRVRLGAAGEPAQDLGAVEADLDSGVSGSFALADVRPLAGLEPPHGVERHWSHETETVYDGGTIRINGLDIRFLDVDGETIAVGSYGTRQGLHVGVNASELGKVLGSSLTSVAAAFERMAARRGAALADLLGLLATPREQSSLAPASQPD